VKLFSADNFCKKTLFRQKYFVFVLQKKFGGTQMVHGGKKLLSLKKINTGDASCFGTAERLGPMR
jgi:hypothetical protein